MKQVTYDFDLNPDKISWLIITYLIRIVCFSSSLFSHLKFVCDLQSLIAQQAQLAMSFPRKPWLGYVNELVHQKKFSFLKSLATNSKAQTTDEKKKRSCSGEEQVSTSKQKIFLMIKNRRREWICICCKALAVACLWILIRDQRYPQYKFSLLLSV